VVANPQHVKKVPGHKTDLKDAEWIADLLYHGLLRSSFVRPKPIRKLRDLTRYRRKLVESQAAERNRPILVGGFGRACSEIGPGEAIFRSVKSMVGERLEVANLGWHGIDGDRPLAFGRIDDRSGCRLARGDGAPAIAVTMRDLRARR
jgi:hypothetical protein